jgi:hypothetical protein
MSIGRRTAANRVRHLLIRNTSDGLVRISGWLGSEARAFPQTTIILNHVGGPLGIGPYADKKEETFAVWKAGIAELGKCQNVVVKLGGLGMLFGMFDFHTA